MLCLGRCCSHRWEKSSSPSGRMFLPMWLFFHTITIQLHDRSRLLPCSFEAEFQGQSVWIYGTSLRRRAVRDEASAPRRRQLSGTVPRGATPHTDGAVRPSRSISQSKEHRLLEVHLPLCSFANSYAFCSHGVTLIACVAHAGGSARRAAPRRLAQNLV